MFCKNGIFEKANLKIFFLINCNMSLFKKKIQSATLSPEAKLSEATLEVDNDAFDPCYTQDLSYDCYANHTTV